MNHGKACEEFIILSEKFNSMVMKISSLIGKICATEKELKSLSIKDTLTGAYNRNYFEKIINNITRENKCSIGIILCDVDGLKLINDSLGHNVGDNILRDITKIIEICLPYGAMLFRIGGDEFAILILDVEETSLSNIENKIRKQMNYFNEAHQEYLLSISIGFANSNGYCQNFNELFKEADRKMYMDKLNRSKNVRSSIVKALMKSMDTRDFFIDGHGKRLQSLINKFGKKLELPQEKINDLCFFAKVHDIGKSGISDSILFKQGSLNEEEMKEIKKHCEIGFRIAQSSLNFRHISDWILKHHEWWNGEGYPLKIKGEEIPLESRMLTIADAYDSMTNDRPYRKALSHDEAIMELKRCSGAMFDPTLVNIFIEIV